MQFKINIKLALVIWLFLTIFKTYSQTINSHGVAGYINMPSALMLEEGSMNFHLSRNIPDRKILVTGSPFNWLDATIFYVDITEKEYGPGSSTQSYKDKGFNFKVKVLDANNWPMVAIGMNDFAGTGVYNSEYIVATDLYGRFEYSLGLGWGRYNSGLRFKNPFIYFHKQFEERSQGYEGKGGSLDYGDYFSGKKASLFAGASYAFSKDLKFLIEYDTTIIEQVDPTSAMVQRGYRKPYTNFNFGAELKYKTARVKASFNRGNTFLVDVSYKTNFLDFNQPKAIGRPAQTYADLQKIFELNSIGLKSIKSNSDSIEIKVRQNSYTNQSDVNRIVFDTSREIAKDKSRIYISQEAHNMEILKVFYPTNKNININKESYEAFEASKNNYIVKENYPIIRNKISPKVRTMIGAREGFLFSGLLLEDDLEIILKENIYLISNFKSSVIDDFDGLYVPPVDVYPNQVRSDIKEYLRNFDEFFIGRMELNYFKSLNRKHFFRVSAGLLEEMFAGIGVDYSYYPEGSLGSVGFELYSIKKRDYKMEFGLLDYSNNLARVHAQYTEPRSKINLKISYGEYLAGDVGATFEFARRFRNGVKFSAFFSRTNVPIELYGEGSYDKGIKFTIPLRGIFNSDRSLTSFEWHPLTKDPAALLNKSVNLLDEITRFRFYF